ncbi:hypothetical protein [Paenibacillus elgii]|nr:hypothetical protein [Paenibacillus elgii]
MSKKYYWIPVLTQASSLVPLYLNHVDVAIYMMLVAIFLRLERRRST